MKCSLRIQINELSQVGEARRLVSQYSRYLFPSEVDQGKIAPIVSEPATNRVKHAGGGALLITEYATALDPLRRTGRKSG